METNNNNRNMNLCEKSESSTNNSNDNNRSMNVSNEQESLIKPVLRRSPAIITYETDFTQFGNPDENDKKQKDNKTESIICLLDKYYNHK